MEKKSKKRYAMAPVAALWLILAVWCWLRPSDASSVSERRPLTQFPGISVESLGNGSFMEKFEDYTLDQFPLRDAFRTLKSLFHYYAMNQSDNNDIYIVFIAYFLDNAIICLQFALILGKACTQAESML